LAQLVSLHGAPRHPRSDNAPEFVVGEPQNATDESFNGRLRVEYLSLNWFRHRVDAKVGIEQWRAITTKSDLIRVSRISRRLNSKRLVTLS
jgi:putative transposase